MKRSTLYAGIAALGLCLAGATLAADEEAAAPRKPKAAAIKKAKKQAAAKVKLVDINGASKEDLMKLPNIKAEDADKIIAGRPYGSKAWLMTHKVLPDGIYFGLKDLVIAKQPNADAAQNAALYAPKKK